MTKPTIDMPEVNSSMASHAGYDPNLRELHVRFKNGNTFAYEGVGADKAHTVLNAASFGTALNKHVLGNKHKARKL